MACVGVQAEFCDSCTRYILTGCIRGVGACRIMDGWEVINGERGVMRWKHRYGNLTGKAVELQCIYARINSIKRFKRPFEAWTESY
jgi:hypothetical protein